MGNGSFAFLFDRPYPIALPRRLSESLARPDCSPPILLEIIIREGRETGPAPQVAALLGSLCLLGHLQGFERAGDDQKGCKGAAKGASRRTRRREERKKKEGYAQGKKGVEKKTRNASRGRGRPVRLVLDLKQREYPSSFSSIFLLSLPASPSFRRRPLAAVLSRAASLPSPPPFPFHKRARDSRSPLRAFSLRF